MPIVCCAQYRAGSFPFVCITFCVGARYLCASVTVKSIPKSNQPSEIINEMKLRTVRAQGKGIRAFPISTFRSLHVHARYVRCTSNRNECAAARYLSIVFICSSFQRLITAPAVHQLNNFESAVRRRMHLCALINRTVQLIAGKTNRKMQLQNCQRDRGNVATHRRLCTRASNHMVCLSVSAFGCHMVPIWFIRNMSGLFIAWSHGQASTVDE